MGKHTENALFPEATDKILGVGHRDGFSKQKMEWEIDILETLMQCSGSFCFMLSLEFILT